MDNSAEQPIRVLVVEDDPTLRVLFEMLLKRDGMIVFSAEDGECALKVIPELALDVILTDMVMPVMDGLELIRRHKESNMALPIIAMSSLDSYLVEAKRLGANAIFPKDSEPEVLTGMIRSLVKQGFVEEADLPERLVTEEAHRLAVIIGLGLNKKAPEESLYKFMNEVAYYFDCPSAFVSVVTEDRQFWTAGCGIPDDYKEELGGPRSQSFCTHALASKSALVVQDASNNPVFKNNPFVVNGGFRFYAGVPLTAREGEPLGTLCIVDHRPRMFTYYDLELLSLFSRRVLSVLERREKANCPNLPDSAFRYLSYVDEEFDTFGRAAISDLVIVESCRAIEQGRVAALALIELYEDEDTESDMINQMRQRRRRSLVGRIGAGRLAWIVPDAHVSAIEADLLECCTADATIKSIQLDRHPGNFRHVFEELEASLSSAVALHNAAPGSNRRTCI